MNVKDAKVIMKEWVDTHAQTNDDFRGAFYIGSINWMEDEYEIPPSSDVDIKIVLDGGKPELGLNTFRYRDVLVDITYVGSEELGTAEDILQDFALACHFSTDCIISDPTGKLRQLQYTVSQQYAKRDWVIKRCELARNKSVNFLNLMDNASTLHEKLLLLTPTVGNLSHMLLTANLKDPPVTKCFMASQRTLKTYNNLELHELILDAMGIKNLSNTLIDQLYKTCINIFDVAVNYVETPSMFSQKIQVEARDNTLGTIQTQIDQGYPRESMMWVSVVHSTCQIVFINDAPHEVAAKHMPAFENLLDALSLSTVDAFQRKSEQIKDLTPKVWAMCETIMDENPQITD